MGTLILPPEWAPQAFVLLAWPHPEGDFAPWLKQVEHTYALITTAISQRQGLVIACRDHTQQKHIQTVLDAHRPTAANIHFVTAPFRDVWVRDTAPLAVWETDMGGLETECDRNRPWPSMTQPRLVDFRFNGWGGKYPYREDDALGTSLYHQGVFGQVPYRRVEWVLEGASLETDGCGTLIATRSSIQNPNRNPDPHWAETKLRTTLGLRRFLWLDHGHLQGDDTDGHIDTLVRFCNLNTLIYQGCTDPSDPHFLPLQAMSDQLAGFRNSLGETYRLMPLPLPRPIHDATGRRLPASYANFLIINDAVLAPQYDDPADTTAITCLARCFPQRKVIPIPARPLIRQYGSVHCLSMQYPLPFLCG